MVGRIWLLDYSIVRMCTIIPQARRSPENVNDRRHHVMGAILQIRIFFLQQDSTLVFSLL